MGVGAKGEARIVVSQHTADGLDVYPVLEGQGRERVSEIMEAYMFQLCIFLDLFLEFYHRVWVVHLSGDRRGEHVLILWMPAVLLDKQINRILWNRYLPY